MRIYPFNSTCNNIVEMNSINNYYDNSCNNNSYNNICDNSYNEQICAICLEDVNINNIFLECDHLFHQLCIIRWSRKQIFNKQPPTCPLCKNQYEYNTFSNKILLYYINHIETYMEKFKLVLKNKSISNGDKNNIRKLLKKYQIFYKTLKYEKKNYKECFHKSKYFTCSINPIPDNIIQLISITEQQIREKEQQLEYEKNNTSENDNNLLPEKYTNFCKIGLCSIIKYICS